jgi:hypothetical protein
VAQAIKAETEQAAALAEQRIASLGEAQVRKVELEIELAELRNRLPRLDAEVQAKAVQLDEAAEHYRSRLNTLASITGLPVAALLAPTTDPLNDGQLPRWRTLERLEMRADVAGVVESISITDGGWIETGGLALTIVDPSAVRFRAQALQGDMAKFHNGQQGMIVPPQGGSVDLQSTIPCVVSLGFQGKSAERTIPIYATPETLPTWAKPGVSAFLEIFTSGAQNAELAIPRSAVVRDELTPVFFRRDPANPDKVIRVEADLGIDDGRWVVINSGVKPGDEVVLDGAYQLMLAGSGKPAQGGHFHADGTFHAGKDE